MDQTIQTPAEEASAARIDKDATIIMLRNKVIKLIIDDCRASLIRVGKPEMFQNKHYDWNDVVGLLGDMAPTPNAEQARAFVAEREDV